MPVRFFEELKQRRLFRIVVGYLAAGWVGLQAMDQLTGQGLLPDAAYQLALVWYLTGIPTALVLGWFHGEKGDQRASRGEIALLLLLAAVGVAGSAPIVSEEVDRRMRLEAATDSELDLHRVGVLYFEDHSPGDSLQYLADGLTEALIDELSAVRALDVVSRNGVAPFRGTRTPRDSVARALEAGTLVEGTVQRVGDRIRVGLVLVDGMSGAEFERAVLERPADELFEARTETIDRTAHLLRAWLGEEVHLRTTRRETGSVAAWAQFHRADRRREDAELALRDHDADAAATAFADADTLASRAEVVDASWADPALLRGRIAYRRARIAAGAGEEHPALDWIETGLGHAERALRIDPNHAEAFEIRGTLRYLRYLLGADPSPDDRRRLLADARDDLERAVDLDPTLASAHATLSHLYTQTHETSNVVLSARRAYEEDAYLDNAESVVSRIFFGTYQLEQFTESRRWCGVGQRRFPEHSDFVFCELLLMTVPGGTPDPERAWQLVGRIDTIAPEYQAEWERLQAEIVAGGVVALAGDEDSARSVWRRARGRATAEVDETRWLRALEAHLHTLIGDHEEAVELLEVYAAVNPGANFEDNWWWRDLQDHPGFRRLAAHSGHGGSPTH